MTTDAIAPLVFTGQLCLSSDGGVTWVDVSDEVTKAIYHPAKDVVAVPATLGKPKSSRGGGNDPGTLEVGFLATDGTDGTIFPMFWAAAATTAGTLKFALTLHAATGEAPANPLWCGEIIVSGAELGGDAEALSESSQSFPLTDLPTFTEA